MINKQNLWFLTLFSLILVLSVYYITMPSELLMATNNGSKEDTETVSASVENEESAELVALRVESEEKMLDEITELKKVLTDSNSTTEEKNEAFEKMQTLNKNSSGKVYGKDHSFLVYNLNKNAKLYDPSTWGSKAIIADAWCNIVMSAYDALSYYRHFFSCNPEKEFQIFFCADKIKLKDKIC